MNETLHDIIEYLANELGNHSGHVDGEPLECRACWTEGMMLRILEAVRAGRRAAA